MLSNLDDCDSSSVMFRDTTMVSNNNIGTVDVQVLSPSFERVWIQLTNVLYVPELGINLILVPCLESHKCFVMMKNGSCTLTDLKNINISCISSQRDDGLYWVNLKLKMHPGITITPKATPVSSVGSRSLNLWPESLGHAD